MADATVRLVEGAARVEIAGSDQLTPYVDAAKFWADDARATAQMLAALGGFEIDRRTLNIAGGGDSHTNGSLLVAAANDGSGSLLGLQMPLGPLDRTWNGTGVDAYARLDSAINDANSPNVSRDQAFTAVGANTAGWLSMLPSMLRSGYPYLGAITTANLGAGGSSAYTWAGEQASGWVKANANANDGDTVTIAGQVYTFRTVPAAAYDVLIAGSADLTARNLANAVNAEGSGFFATGTAPNASAWATNPSGSTFFSFAALETGTAGNSLTVESSNTTRITAFNLEGTFSAVSPAPFMGGSATSALYENAKAKLAGGAGLVPDVWAFTLGTNDANRPGYRARKTQVELAKLVAKVHTDFPSAKIILHRPPVIATGATSTATLADVVIPAIDAVVLANSSFVSSIDIFSLGTGTGNVRILNPTDGIHLTPYGYSVMAQMFARKIGTALGL